MDSVVIAIDKLSLDVAKHTKNNHADKNEAQLVQARSRQRDAGGRTVAETSIYEAS